MMRNNVEENEDNTEDIKTLLTVCKINGEYYIYHKKDMEDESVRDREKAYEVIKYSRTDNKTGKGVRLEKGMRIKIGRITFTLKDFSTSETNEREEEKRLLNILN